MEFESYDQVQGKVTHAWDSAGSDLNELRRQDGEPPPRKTVTCAANPTASKGNLGVNEASRNANIYDPVFSDKPRCHSPDGSSLGESMNNHNENVTPPASPSPSDSTGAITAHGIGRLSLTEEPGKGISGTRSRGRINEVGVTSTKRTASELAPESNKSPQEWRTVRNSQGNARKPQVRHRTMKARGNKAKQNAPSCRDSDNLIRIQYEQAQRSMQDRFGPSHKDSGYASAPASRENTAQSRAFEPDQFSTNPISNVPLTRIFEKLDSPVDGEFNRFLPKPLVPQRYPGLILQPESSPISKDQLAAEVKGIYSGLAMVEAKCINIDNAQAADPQSKLEPEQWQALIALHRTLLYEHHDFLMATQHPSATEALRGLANKYSMPARMWKHGIHAFLEVLRHRRPESQDYMLAFIYLAYQMIALLFETVPTFLDTWIECLGDLARYRMAIEEEREAHATWGSVAARWYRMAADRHPTIGRLNHHLGILERPSLRKLSLYAKSLTCVVPFVNARDSLATLCGPIVHDEEAGQYNTYTVEFQIVILYAFLFSAYDNENKICKTAENILIRLDNQPTSKIRDFGVESIVTGVAFLMELGNPRNGIWQHFACAVNDAIQTARPSNAGSAEPAGTDTFAQEHSLFTPTFATSLIYDFYSKSFSAMIRHRKDRQSLRDVLSLVHSMLVWLHGVYITGLRNAGHGGFNTCSSLLNPEAFPWGELSDFLNMLLQFETISARTMEFARQGTFLTPERADDTLPLPEDFSLRGLIWTHFYYPSDWFSEPVEDDGRAIETASTHRARVERVQWLSLYLAFRVEHLKFDMCSWSFYVPASAKSPWSKSDYSEANAAPCEMKPKQLTPSSQPSATVSDHSDSEGYTVVTSSKSKASKKPRQVSHNLAKSRGDCSMVKVVDEDLMQWEQCQ